MGNGQLAQGVVVNNINLESERKLNIHAKGELVKAQTKKQSRAMPGLRQKMTLFHAKHQRQT